MSVSVNAPEELYRRAAEVRRRKTSRWTICSPRLLKIRLLEFEGLKEKASHGSYEKFRRVMSKAPAVEPPEYDRL